MSEPSAVNARVRRHAAVDRIVHWVFAATIIFLLGTGFLPIIGIQFEWVTLHWSAGLILLLVLIVHIWRAWLKTKLRNIWFGLADLRLIIASIRSNPKPGKYSPAQKMMHLGVTVLVLATLVTGLVMMVKVDTPFWERNPYMLEADTWGIIYVIHGFAAMLLITTIMLHIYFALRPEKRLYLRSMWQGMISEGELERYHDPEKWQGDQ